jgi:hypothetical protein
MLADVINLGLLEANHKDGISQSLTTSGVIK